MATEIVDLSALTEPGIEAIAKRHMTQVDQPHYHTVVRLILKLTKSEKSAAVLGRLK